MSFSAEATRTVRDDTADDWRVSNCHVKSVAVPHFIDSPCNRLASFRAGMHCDRLSVFSEPCLEALPLAWRGENYQTVADDFHAR